MESFGRIEKLIEKGDVLILDRLSDENPVDVVYVANVARNQENVCGYRLEEEQLGSLFPRIKYYLGYHACYFQAKYDPERKQYVSAIMTGQFFDEDVIFRELVANSDNLMDSMLGLEEKIATMMQSSNLLRRIKI